MLTGQLLPILKNSTQKVKEIFKKSLQVQEKDLDRRLEAQAYRESRKERANERTWSSVHLPITNQFADPQYEK